VAVIATWCFLATLLVCLGSEDMGNAGMVWQNLQYLISLPCSGYDIEGLATIGTATVDYSFVWKLVVLWR
jgi:hypothetical protein